MTAPRCRNDIGFRVAETAICYDEFYIAIYQYLIGYVVKRKRDTLGKVTRNIRHAMDACLLTIRIVPQSSRVINETVYKLEARGSHIHITIYHTRNGGFPISAGLVSQSSYFVYEMY